MPRVSLIILFVTFFSLSSLAQDRFVMKKFPDGSPYIVWYVVEKNGKKEKVKEEVYFRNGNLDYVGNFKNGVEHGEWVYYYENGKKKAVEVWKNGKETGIFLEFNEDGSLKLEQHYKNGKLVEEIKH